MLLRGIWNKSQRLSWFASVSQSSKFPLPFGRFAITLAKLLVRDFRRVSLPRKLVFTNFIWHFQLNFAHFRIGGFIFLRFINPAIVSPENIDLDLPAENRDVSTLVAHRIKVAYHNRLDSTRACDDYKSFASLSKQR